MLKNITIRRGLTLVICVFVMFLLTVIGVGWGALKSCNDGLQSLQRSSAATLSLTASSEKLLQVRLALGSYETLFSVGKETDGLLAAAHKVLVESNNDFRAYMSGPFGSDEERKLAQAVSDARTALVDQAIEPEHKALVDNDFGTFRTIQGETADHFYRIYAKSIDALQRAQAENRERQAGQMSQRYMVSTTLFMAIGVAS